MSSYPYLVVEHSIVKHKYLYGYVGRHKKKGSKPVGVVTFRLMCVAQLLGGGSKEVKTKAYKPFEIPPLWHQEGLLVCLIKVLVYFV